MKNVLGIDLDTNGISFLSEDLSHLDNNVKTKQMSNLEQTALEQIEKSRIVKTNTKVKTEEKFFMKKMVLKYIILLIFILKQKIIRMYI